MNVLKYLFALWVGVLAYTSLCIIFGATGISAYRQLSQERNKHVENIENIKNINRELEDTLNSLLYDVDTMAVLAREQGYASPSERFIRIVGLGVNQKIRTFAGEPIFTVDPQYVPDKTFRIIAFCIAGTMVVCMAFFDIMKSLSDKTDY